MAGGPGIEPGFTDPQSVVLPLDDPPTRVVTLPTWLCLVKDLKYSQEFLSICGEIENVLDGQALQVMFKD